MLRAPDQILLSHSPFNPTLSVTSCRCHVVAGRQDTKGGRTLESFLRNPRKDPQCDKGARRKEPIDRIDVVELSGFTAVVRTFGQDV